MKHKKTYPIKVSLNTLIFIVFCAVLQIGYAQETKISKEAEKYMAEASVFIENNNFADAEASLRKAISIDPENKKAAYNFGNLYINNDKNRNAFQRLVEAASENDNKTIKHKSFHNQGNIFMKEERYAEAVEAYKNALRNNPNDDETRYNLALAKQNLEDEGGDGGDDEDQENQKEQEQENEGQGENEDENQGQEKESDQNDNQKGDNKDQKNEGEGENEPKDGENEEQEKEQPKNGKSTDDKKDGEQQQPPPEQMQGKLSPEQLKNLLEAIENQD